jgi:hypothetical protein
MSRAIAVSAQSRVSFTSYVRSSLAAVPGAGSVKKNVAPRPRSDSTQMRPPWRSRWRR